MSSTKKRLDVAFPLDTYEKIKAIALETNQPVHHKSGEVMLTPVVLNLVNLGLERLAEEGLDCLSDKKLESSDKSLNLSDIERSLEKKLTQYLDKKIDKKIDELRSLLTAKPQPIPHITPENPLPVPGTVPISSTADRLVQISNNLAQAGLPSAGELPQVAIEMSSQDNVKPLLTELKEIKSNGNGNDKFQQIELLNAKGEGEIHIIEVLGKDFEVVGKGVNQSWLGNHRCLISLKTKKPNKSDNGARVCKQWEKVEEGLITLTDFIEWTKQSDVKESNGWVKGDDGLFYQVV